MRRLSVALVLALVVVAMPVSVGAQPLPSPGSVTLWEPGGLEPLTIARAQVKINDAGASSIILHRGTLQLLSVMRRDEVVQQAAPGFRFPMDTVALDPGPSWPLLGADAVDVLSAGDLVMGATSARLRGAQVGDVVTFNGWDGEVRQAIIGLIAPDPVIFYAELVFSAEVAAEFEFVRPSSMHIWNMSDSFRADLESEFDRERIGIKGSDDSPNPSGVLPSVLIKERFGEFSYRPTSGDAVVIDKTWTDANIVTVNSPLLGVFKCHRLLVPYLEAAIDDVIRSGLASHIDSADFQLAGGCFNARLIRGGDKGGALSRHAYGAAIDFNPSSNPYGGVVSMDERIGDIFHYWGFAWGGGWVFSDGGHFEWRHLPHQVASA